jgi:hypothetical protein
LGWPEQEQQSGELLVWQSVVKVELRTELTFDNNDIIPKIKQ